MNGHLTVISCGLNANELPPQYREYINRADVLAGGQRLLDSVPEFPRERIPGGAHARENERVWRGTYAACPVEEIDMTTLVIFGNSATERVNGRLLTRRGYSEKTEFAMAE
jgi:precorrin-3B methylase